MFRRKFQLLKLKIRMLTTPQHATNFLKDQTALPHALHKLDDKFTKSAKPPAADLQN
jgi:hypothetical protein